MTVWNWRNAALGLSLTLVSVAAAAQPTPPKPGFQVPGGPPAAMPSIQVGNLEVRDITFGSADTGTVSIGHMTFAGFVSGAETVRAEKVTFENIIAQAGPHRAEIPTVTITGFEVPAEFFRALTEGATAGLDWARLLQKSVIGEISFGETTIKHSEAQAETSVAKIAFKNFANGRLESFRIEGIHARDKSDATDKSAIRIGEIQFLGIDAAEFLRFFTGGGSGSAKPLVDRATISGIAVAADDMALQAGKIELAGVNGRAPERGWRAAPAVTASGLIKPTQDVPEEQRIAAYARDVIRLLRIDRFEFEAVKFLSPSQGNFEVGAFALSGVSLRGLDLAEIKGVDLAASHASVKFERFAIEKIAFGGLLDLVLDAAAEGREPDFAPAKLAQLTPRIGAIRLAKLALDTPSGPMSLAEARLEVDNPEAAIPEKMTLAFNGFKLDLDKWKDNKGGERLRALGYAEVSADTQLQVRWSPAERALLVENSGLTIDKVGRIDLDMRLGEVAIVPGVAPEVAQQIMRNARVETATLRVADLGLADRLFGQITRNAKISPEAVRAGLAAEVRAQAVARFAPALTPGSAEAIEAFIRAPRRIVARAVPRPDRPPLTVGELETLGPQGLMDRIQIAVEIPQD